MRFHPYVAAAALAFQPDISLAIPSPAAGALSALQALDYRYFVAGGTCAALSHGVTTPIDVVKTKIQSEPEKYGKGMRQAALEIIKTEGPGVLLAGLGPTIVGYGIEGAMKFGVYEVMKPVFAALLNAGDDSSSRAIACLLASVMAGAVAALLLCPMESTRIKMVTDPDYAHDNLLSALARIAQTEGLRNTFGGLWAMLSKQVPYTFGKQVSFDVFAGMLYSIFGTMQKQWTVISDGNVKWAVSVFAAAGASLVACILSQPGDMVLTETYKPKKNDADTEVLRDSSSTAMVANIVDAADEVMVPQSNGNETVSTTFTKDSGDEFDNAPVANESSTPMSVSPPQWSHPAPASAVADESSSLTKSGNPSTTAIDEHSPPSSTEGMARKEFSTPCFIDIVKKLYHEGGIPKFFTGTQARIVHVGLIITSQLVVYDIVKQLLGLPATGSH